MYEVLGHWYEPFLYNQSESCVRILGTKFLSLCWTPRVQFGDLRIASLLFADDVVLLASSDHDQHALGRFSAECEAACMRVSTSKSQAMVLCQKMVESSLRVGSELMPQVKEKYLRVVFMSEGKMEWEMYRQIGAVSAAMWPLCHSLLVKRELSRKVKVK